MFWVWVWDSNCWCLSFFCKPYPGIDSEAIVKEDWGEQWEAPPENSGKFSVGQLWNDLPVVGIVYGIDGDVEVTDAVPGGQGDVEEDNLQEIDAANLDRKFFNVTHL